MNPSGSATSCQSGQKSKPKRIVHRIVVVTCGSMAVIGCVLGIWVHPNWAVLSAIGAVMLLLFPET